MNIYGFEISGYPKTKQFSIENIKRHISKKYALRKEITEHDIVTAFHKCLKAKIYHDENQIFHHLYHKEEIKFKTFLKNKKVKYNFFIFYDISEEDLFYIKLKYDIEENPLKNLKINKMVPPVN